MTDNGEKSETGSANSEVPTSPALTNPNEASLPAAELAETAVLTPNYAPPVAGTGTIPPAFGVPPTAAPHRYIAQGETAPAPASPKSSRTSVVAALIIAVIIGGISGGGVVAATMGANQNSFGGTSTAVGGPANITVNDPSNATTITAVAASAGPSVVTISVNDGASSSSGTGSGVVLSKDGYILTNTHVVTLDGASAKPNVSVQTSDGHLYSAKIIGTDPISDLAVIKVQKAVNLQPAAFADSSKLNVGDVAVAIGAPLGLSNTVTNGIVSSLNRSITVASSAVPTTPEDTAPKNQNSPFDFWQFGTPNQSQTNAASTISLSVIQTDAAINPGNSGGALLNSSGKVIGINVAIASAGSGSSGGGQAGSIGVGFAIPSNFAKRIADEIISTGKGSHGLLGASVSDVTSPTATVVGANIEKVTAGGAASASGLVAGDIITAIGGIPVTSKTDLTAQVRSLAAGSKTTLTYVRGGNSETVNITLGSLN